MPGAIKLCTCDHEFQDKRYGKKRRVHTIGGTSTTNTYTCTVCGSKK